MQTIKAYANLIIAIFVILLLASTYFFGVKQGKDSVRLKNYKEEISAYEDARTRSIDAYKKASEQSAIDFKSAIEASEKRQALAIISEIRRKSLEDTTRQAQYVNPVCVLDTETLKTINNAINGDTP